MNLHTLLKEREAEFDEKFPLMEQVDSNEVDGTFVLETDKEKVKSFHRDTFRMTVEAVMRMVQKMKKPTYDGREWEEANKIDYYNDALTDLSTKLKEILDTKV